MWNFPKENLREVIKVTQLKKMITKTNQFPFLMMSVKKSLKDIF